MRFKIGDMVRYHGNSNDERICEVVAITYAKDVMQKYHIGKIIVYPDGRLWCYVLKAHVGRPWYGHMSYNICTDYCLTEYKCISPLKSLNKLSFIKI